MIGTIDVGALFYLAEVALVALAQGALSLHAPRLLPVNRVSRFLIGFCATPFTLGAWTVAVAAVIPGASRWLFLLPPILLAVLGLLTFGRRSLTRLWRGYRRMPGLFRQRWLLILLYLCLAGALALVGTKQYANARVPIISHDALVYLDEALRFADARSLAAVEGFRGAEDGTMRGDVHSFIFPAFLSHALMSTVGDSLGYPRDQAARLAFQLTFDFMLLSVVALGLVAGVRGAGVVATILFLQVPQLEYIVYANSRDAFRIIPLLLLATYLSGLGPRRLRAVHSPLALLPAVLLGAASVAGHSLGVPTSLLIGLAWAVWVFTARGGGTGSLAGVGLALVALLAGLLLGGSHYVQAYVATGNVAGDNAFRDSAIAGTVLADEVAMRDNLALGEAGGSWQRVLSVLTRDGGRLTIPTLATLPAALLLWHRRGRYRSACLAWYIALAVLLSLLPLTGVFDTQSLKLSEWFALNFRYALHWYPLAAAWLSLLAACLVLSDETARSYLKRDTVTQPRRKLLSLVSHYSLVGLLLISTASAYETVFAKWRVPSWNDEWLQEQVRPFETALRALPEGNRLLLDDDRYNYYLHGKAVLMYSRPTWSLFRVADKEGSAEALASLRVGAVSLLDSQVKGWWDKTALYSLLTDPMRAKRIEGNGSSSIYLIQSEE